MKRFSYQRFSVFQSDFFKGNFLIRKGFNERNIFGLSGFTETVTKRRRRVNSGFFSGSDIVKSVQMPQSSVLNLRWNTVGKNQICIPYFDGFFAFWFFENRSAFFVHVQMRHQKIYAVFIAEFVG